MRGRTSKRILRSDSIRHVRNRFNCSIHVKRYFINTDIQFQTINRNFLVIRVSKRDTKTRYENIEWLD